MAEPLVLTAQVEVDLTGQGPAGPLTLGPSPGRVVDELRRLEDAGVSHVQVIFADDASLDRFVEGVVPAFG